jgi:hypothetical protein
MNEFSDLIIYIGVLVCLCLCACCVCILNECDRSMIATALFNPVALMPRHTIPVTRHTIPVTRHTIPIVVVKGQTIPIVDYGEFT